MSYDCIDAGTCNRGIGYACGGRKDGKIQLAHRAAWMKYFGPIPAGMNVCHHCDNRRCVNIAHLFLGTQRDNMRDASNKGRLRGINAGEKHGMHKLTSQDVTDIIKMEGTQKEIAALFGIDQSQVSNIKRRKYWRNI